MVPRPQRGGEERGGEGDKAERHACVLTLVLCLHTILESSLEFRALAQRKLFAKLHTKALVPVCKMSF